MSAVQNQPQQQAQEQPQLVHSTPHLASSHPPPLPQQQPPTIDFPHAPVPISLPNSTAIECLANASQAEKDAISALQSTTKLLLSHPQYAIPPPANIIIPKLATQVAKAKADGNSCYAKAQYLQAARLYTLGIDLALTRPEWESTITAREELAVLLSNRSVTYLHLGQPENALIDAETILKIKRFWPRAFLRKSRALLALGRQAEALDTLHYGLEYEATDKELLDERAIQNKAYEGKIGLTTKIDTTNEQRNI